MLIISKQPHIQTVAALLFVAILVIADCPLLAKDEPASADGAAPDEPKFAAEDVQFFEAKIRPVLVQHCYECHSQDAAKGNKLKGSLLVDTRAALLKGGDSGPAIAPGNLDESLLLDALRYESLQMPPKGKLPATVIADFETWIKQGAADPRRGDVNPPPRPGIDIAAGRNHWAYRPLPRVAIPNVQAPDTVRVTPIDAFILSRLESHQFSFAPEADRATLARRLYFDLIGMPPTPEELDAFLANSSNDDSNAAYEQLVDRLLASPHFGERWGRHWLSVARFAESMTLRGFVFPEAWRYRDYVIESFNQDRPFDRFVIEQIAGDLLPAASLDERRRNLIATTYLALGNINLEEQDKKQLRMDAVDEQLDAISKGFLAQTVTCARCHDHKFDPIPTRDYYALAGILSSTKTLEHSNVSKWLEFPLPLEPELEAVMQRQDAAVAALQAKIKGVKEATKLLADGKKGSSPPAGVVAAKDLPGIVVDDQQAKVVGEWKLSQYTKPYIGEGYLHDLATGKGEKTITLLPELKQAGKYEVRLAYTPGVNRSEAVPVTVFSADGEKTIKVNQRETPPIDGRFVSLGQYRFELNGQGFVIVSNEGTRDHVIVDAVQFLPVEMLNADPASKPAAADTAKETDEDKAKAAQLAQELRNLEQELKNLVDQGPKRPMYMSVQEEATIADTHVHIRGTVHNLGERVPRGFLQVATYGTPPAISAAQSGRKELGEWIASRDNPLTPRVLANRVWSWLFGAGLVRTTDNFGTTGELPSHPELIDYLAQRLLEENWSVKRLVREIVLSHTYRQSSAADARKQAADPENRLLSRRNRKRLDAECLLDAILTTSGRLGQEVGGKTFRPGLAEDYGYKHDSTRRAVYWPVFRNSLPEIFDVFDFADPSTVAGARNTSTVAPQALFFMNDAWVIAESQHAARKLLAEPLPDDTARLQQAFRRTLGRLPTEAESRLSLSYVTTSTAGREEFWSQLFQALFASMDFRYVE